MAKLSALARTKEITFTWPDSDETLNLVVLPDVFTGKKLVEMRERANQYEGDEQEFHYMCTFLAKLIKSWDLTDDEGTSIPISAESLFDTLPVTLVAVLLTEIQKGIGVNP